MRSDRLSARTRVARGLLGVATALALATAFVLARGEISLSSCLFHDLTGYSCFTCGLTRSLHALSNGYLMASLRLHLLGPFLFAGMVLTSILWLSQALTGRTVQLMTHSRISGSLVFTLAVLWVIYGVVRMVTELLA